MKYVKPEIISMQNHPEFRENWVQDIIAADPSVLGLGDLDLKDKERRQPRAGRLDLLLQNTESKRRYEVEVQLGQTDESHIIRTLEYWDIEKKRYPNYDHCAVIVAEKITSRFLNVISLFNGTIPLVAIQMSALRLGDMTTLTFTTVLDEVVRGEAEDDEDGLIITVDRAYWEKRATPKSVKLADSLLGMIHAFDPTIELSYNKHYIGLFRSGLPFNFATFRPRKSRLNLEIKLPQSEEIDAIIDEAGLDTLEYNARWQIYRLSLSAQDISSHSDVLIDLLQKAFLRRSE